MIKYLSIISSTYKKWLYLFVLCAFVNVLLDTLSIIMVLPLLTFLFDVKENVGSSFFFTLIENFFFNFGINEKKNIQIFFLFFFAFLFIIKNIYHIIFIYFQNKLFSAIEAEIGIRVIKSSLYGDVQLNNEKNTAEIIRDSSTQASNFIQNFLVPFVQIAIELITFGLLLLFIGYNYFQETIFITFILLFILFIQYFLVRKKIFLISTNLEIANKLRIKSIIDSQDLFKEIKIFNLYQYFFKEFSKQSFRIMQIQNTLGMMRVVLRPIVETLFIIGICFFIYMILLSDQSVSGTLPKIAVFVLAALRVIPSINRLNLNSQRLRASKPVLINLYSKISSNNFDITFNKIRKLSLKSKLKIKNLYFKYPNKNKFLFKNLNLELKKGKTYFLQGDSGVGKSTFVELLLGLLQPSSGEILVDNKNIKNNLIGWYKSLSYVPQKANLIQETLLKNIILFSEDDNSQRLVSILNLLKLNNLIKESEELGRRGAKISGGQAQRIVIARAMIKNSDICVIDEGTAALDSKSEIDIVKKIITFKVNNVVLFISHKKKLKKYFDYSLVFHNQKIKKIKNGN
jgi:ABC-type multidrug transport system fused ATPase/permease subunit